DLLVARFDHERRFRDILDTAELMVFFHREVRTHEQRVGFRSRSGCTGEQRDGNEDKRQEGKPATRVSTRRKTEKGVHGWWILKFARNQSERDSRAASDFTRVR